ncbi:MAG: TfoX/Sxy family protein [Gemmatimonadaceae bacterium]
MAYDHGLVERVDDALRQINEVGFRQKNVFSGRGFLRGKSTFVIVWRESLLVKTPKDEYAKLLRQKGVKPFAPGGDRPMGTWVEVSSEVIADDPELVEWVERGLRGLGK